MESAAKHARKLGVRPLYKQVREVLLEQITSGTWRPAEALPSEGVLAAELGVSQGTVRKALDALVVENVVERRQGRGTFVAQHTLESALFRFFRLAQDDGAPVSPECEASVVRRRAARALDRQKLDLPPRAQVFEIERTRRASGRPVLHEYIVVSAAKFPELDARGPLPNTLYMFYQSEYGVSIADADERLKASAADGEVAQALAVEEGAPLLLAERVATDLAHHPVEFRRTFYRTDDFHYAISLG